MQLNFDPRFFVSTQYFFSVCVVIISILNSFLFLFFFYILEKKSQKQFLLLLYLFRCQKRMIDIFTVGSHWKKKWEYLGSHSMNLSGIQNLRGVDKFISFYFWKFRFCLEILTLKILNDNNRRVVWSFDSTIISKNWTNK